MCTRASIAVAGMVVSLGLGLAAVGGEVERRVVFREGFEGEGKMTFWASNGPYKVNFAGATAERAATGKRSFKIDVTWTDCTYNYWWAAPLMIPYSSTPRVSGKLLVARGDARLGFSNACPEAETGGNVSRCDKLRTLPSGWTEWASTAEAPPSSTLYVQAVAVYLRPDKERRTVVYLDDLQVEAALPEGYEAAFKASVAEAVDKRRAEMRKEGEKLGARFAELAREMDAVEPKFPKSASPALAECWRQRGDYVRETRSKLEAELKALDATPRRRILASARRLLATLAKAHRFSVSLIRHAEAHSALPYVVWIVDPITNDKVLPDRFPLSSVLGTELRVAACRGEYEPASFAIYAPKGLTKLLAVPADARCGDAVIPASAIDVRMVKCWWQAGVGIGDVRHPTLTPELLLNDPDFVRADDAKQRNALRDPDAPRDAGTLQPVSIPARATQQFWVTVRVPEDARPGVYRGTIRLTAGDAPPVSLALVVRVLPFRLEEPALQYSIYYRGRLTTDGKGSISSEAKSEAQYLAEMRNLKAHGVTHPTCYQGFGELLDRAIELRKQAGVALDPFYSLGICTGAPTTPEALEALKRRVRAGVAQVGRHGIKELYVYGIDEASGARLKAERAAFQATREAGAKVFVACYVGTFELVGDLLDLPVYAHTPRPAEAKKWHGAGHRLFSYANPQVGVEQPETYRRNFGLLLWQAGYDGAMDYAYQHAFTHIWDDFDNRSYRDHVFAYPTVDGVIDTIQWEGFREGVDDVRYVTTLLKAIESAEADEARRPPAAEAAKWLAAIDVHGDLDALRAQVVEWILRLRKGQDE